MVSRFRGSSRCALSTVDAEVGDRRHRGWGKLNAQGRSERQRFGLGGIQPMQRRFDRESGKERGTEEELTPIRYP
jgi:hypothetical protein